MHKTHIDLSDTTRKPVIQLLNDRLADVIDLQLQAKQAHWNVKGPGFIALHKLFDDVEATASEHADLIAERIATFGGNPNGLVKRVAHDSKLPPYPVDISDGLDHVEALATALAAFGKAARAAIDQAAELKDAGTADLFTEVSRATDKNLWFVEAHNQAKR